MEQIGDGQRKPRRTRGTPSYHYRNRFAWATLAVGTVLFGIHHFIPYFRESNNKITKVLFTPTVEELERRELFQRPAARTGRYIEEKIEEGKKLMSER